jgi:hypothetical protein
VLQSSSPRSTPSKVTERRPTETAPHIDKMYLSLPYLITQESYLITQNSFACLKSFLTPRNGKDQNEQFALASTMQMLEFGMQPNMSLCLSLHQTKKLRNDKT